MAKALKYHQKWSKFEKKNEDFFLNYVVSTTCLVINLGNALHSDLNIINAILHYKGSKLLIQGFFLGDDVYIDDQISRILQRIFIFPKEQAVMNFYNYFKYFS